MGLYDPQDSINALNNLQATTPAPAALKPIPEPTELDTGEQLELQNSTAEQNNWVVSLFNNGIGDWTSSNPNYNVWDQIKDTKYEAYADEATKIDNPGELFDWQKEIDERERYHSLASRAPTTSTISAIAWGMADPLMLIPGVGAIRATKAGETAAKVAAITGATSIAAMAGSEAVLQAGNPERTATESAINIVAAGLVGSIAGGIAAKSIDAPIAQTISRESIDSTIKDTLKITEDSIPGDAAATKQMLTENTYRAIDEILEEKPATINPEAKTETELSDEMAAVLNAQSSAVDEELDSALASTGDATRLGEESSAGAREVKDLNARVANLPDWAMKTMSAGKGVLTPLNIEALADSNSYVRYMATRLYNQHLPLEITTETGTTRTAAPSLQAAIDQDLSTFVRHIDELDRSYLSYLKIDPDASTASIQKILAAPKSKLKAREFEQKVIDYMNTGIADVPEVETIGKSMRKMMNDRWAEMQSAKIVEGPPRDNYFMWNWSMKAIMDDRKAFEDMLAKGYAKHQRVEILYKTEDGLEKTDKGWMNLETKSIDWQPKDGEKLTSIKALPVEDIVSEAREAARDTANKMLQLGDRSLELGDIQRLSFERGTNSMRPRVLDQFIRYDEAKPWLVNDLRKLLSNYMSNSSKATRFAQLMASEGHTSLNGFRIKAREVADKQITKLQNIQTKSAAEIAKLPKAEQKRYLTPEKKKAMLKLATKQLQNSEKLLNDMLAISLGQYKVKTSADAFWRISNQYNAMRLLGGVVISSLADPAALLIKNSISDVVWHGYLGELNRWFTGGNFKKKQDFIDASVGIANYMDDVTRWMQSGDQSGFGVGPVESAVQQAGKATMMMNLLTPWNNFGQRIAYGIAEARVIRSVKKGWNNLSAREQAYLNEGGIDERLLKRIEKMVKLKEEGGFADVDRGVFIGNPHLWSDQEARLAYNNLLRLETRKSPIFTEVGDIPRFFQKSDFRRTMFLFKGFPAAATTKLLLSASARRDSRAVTGMIALVSAGMAVKYLQDKIAGKESNYSIADWARFGLDKSGALGHLMDPLFQGMYAAQNIRKYGTRAYFSEPSEYILGPNVSIIDPAYRAIMSKIAGEKVDSRTAYQLKALVPMHNWFILKALFNKDNNGNRSGRP